MFIPGLLSFLLLLVRLRTTQFSFFILRAVLGKHTLQRAYGLFLRQKRPSPVGFLNANVCGRKLIILLVFLLFPEMFDREHRKMQLVERLEHAG